MVPPSKDLPPALPRAAGWGKEGEGGKKNGQTFALSTIPGNSIGVFSSPLLFRPTPLGLVARRSASYLAVSPRDGPGPHHGHVLSNHTAKARSSPSLDRRSGPLITCCTRKSYSQPVTPDSYLEGGVLVEGEGGTEKGIGRLEKDQVTHSLSISARALNRRARSCSSSCSSPPLFSRSIPCTASSLISSCFRAGCTCPKPGACSQGWGSPPQ